MSEAVLRRVQARPRKATVIARVMAAAVVVIFTAVGVGLHGKTDSGTGVFQTSDQIALVGLGVLAAAGILMMTRPRVGVRSAVSPVDLVCGLSAAKVAAAVHVLATEDAELPCP